MDQHSRTPPPLPSRSGTNHPRPNSESISHPHPYQGTHSELWASSDPRSSSQQSLLPAETDHESRRRLLLIYIHGFMGNETSFYSFPSHVHNLVSLLLADSHVVHTKIYPRYKSRRQIQFARDDFSNWLAPHESGSTDVILLGHSMGGLLAAEVVLMPPADPTRVDQSLQHRILGNINFDVPFLGMHPGVISAGLGSLFRPKYEKPAGSLSPEPTSAQDTPSLSSFSSETTADTITTASSHPTRTNTNFSTASSQSDPNFNAPFFNDVVLPVRKGWASTLHFINKHSENLSKGVRHYVISHAEFGGAMADYPGLRRRYDRLRGLEEEDERRRCAAFETILPTPRVRFLNYYTASSGRPKPQSQSADASKSNVAAEGREPLDSSLHVPPSNDPVAGSTTPLQSPSRSPRISVEEYRDGSFAPITTEERPTGRTVDGLDEAAASTDQGQGKVVESSPSTPELMPIPPMSIVEPDETVLNDGASETARESNVPGREPEADLDMLTLEESSQSNPHTNSPDSPLQAQGEEQPTPSTPTDRPKKPAKDRKFCVIPSATITTARDGTRQKTRDPTWVRVYMRGVDEVEAHCGLFIPDSTDQSLPAIESGALSPVGVEDERESDRPDRHYERLVGDVSERIERWVREAEGERVARWMSG
ncbi:hypothetical protein P152DRAFT_133905 [Eremomyces bilateralis CBS 781.70]|uniref:AB hydrolase-1 domain-containing protein n=1 Tax=Eremomyces bilateralis CBS 781.70 TaxID=1392243 RepID=A0A6G1GF06_9PEZI|nr:uncharacterized protein P152DRAFT_133905 [Eremomyces bilateralis CBS 781.70]KAF1816695.1 hypothetical protein P152DRAFT_133905 [Eremomyces bilateralis CBS 781.70]